MPIDDYQGPRITVQPGDIAGDLTLLLSGALTALREYAPEAGARLGVAWVTIAGPPTEHTLYDPLIDLAGAIAANYLQALDDGFADAAALDELEADHAISPPAAAFLRALGERAKMGPPE